jgi:hypothetical protein
MEDASSTQPLSRLLALIIKPQFQQYIPNWFMTATDREKKGISIINKIVESRGKRVFQDKIVELTANKLDEADVEIRKRYMRSKYNEFFGSNVIKKQSESAVLEFK